MYFYIEDYVIITESCEELDLFYKVAVSFN